jgi:hypothetical protein
MSRLAEITSPSGDVELSRESQAQARRDMVRPLLGLVDVCLARGSAVSAGVGARE